MKHVFVLFKKDSGPFFELEIPTSEEIASLRKTRTQKTNMNIYKFNFAGEW
jgi:hypothetical protein